jgi:ferric-dicitrate binding protein FerR (iron transport regulator)
VQVIVQDEQLSQLRLTANFRRDSLSTVLDKIAFAVGVQYTRKGNRITIKPK